MTLFSNKFLIGLVLVLFLITVSLAVLLGLSLGGVFDTKPIVKNSCGVSSIKPSIDGNSLELLTNSRIINGEDAVANSWPWTVSIRATISVIVSAHFCGGTILDEYNILTTAQCISELNDLVEFGVVVGMHNSSESATAVNFYKVSNIFIKEDFDSNTLENDIAILKLEKPIVFDDKVAPICIPNSESDSKKIINKLTAVTGWGSVTGQNNPVVLAPNLQQTLLKVINGDKICDNSSPGYNQNKFYCALGAKKDSSICYGDSGSPLMYYENDVWYLYGLGSYGGSKCSNKEPSFFTQVPAYLSWIKEKMKEPNIKPITTTPLFTGTVPFQNECGQTPIPPSINGNTLNNFEFGKIMNGEDAVANSWPWMVSLRIQLGNSISTHFCGGSLIYDQYVITASHCVVDFSDRQILAVVGLHSLKSQIPSSDIYLVEKVISNNQYSPTQLTNDIAILKLTERVVMSDRVSTVCLPPANTQQNIRNKNVAATGWGSFTGMNSVEAAPTYLQQTVFKVINGDKKCSDASPNYNPDKLFCTLDQSNKNSNVCFGDSGGPFVYFENNRWHIYGIASYVIAANSSGPCLPNQPSFFTQVPAYMNWIASVLN